MLYASYLIPKAEISRLPWKDFAYSSCSKEDKLDAFVFFWKYWQKKNSIQLSALLIKICWTRLQQALLVHTRFLARGQSPVSGGLTVLRIWTPFFHGQSGIWRLGTTKTTIKSRFFYCDINMDRFEAAVQSIWPNYYQLYYYCPTTAQTIIHM